MPYFAFKLVQVSDEITLLDNMNIVYYVRVRIVFIYASHTKNGSCAYNYPDPDYFHNKIKKYIIYIPYCVCCTIHVITCFGGGVTHSTMAAKQETTNQQILQMLGQFVALRQTKSGYFGSDIQRLKYHLILPGQGSLVIKMYITIAGLRQFTAPTFHFQGWRKSSDYPLTNSSNVKTLKEKLVFQI